MRHRHRRKFIGKKLYFFAVLLIIIVVVTINAKLLSIQKISINGSVFCIQDYKLLRTDKLKGENFFLVNIRKFETEIQNEYICVGKINVKKQFPNSIQLEILERKPELTIINIDNEASQSAIILNSLAASASSLERLPKKESFVADDGGVVFSNLKRDDLPKIYLQNNTKLGQKIDKILIQKILEALNKIKIFGITPIASLLTSENNYFVYSNPKIYFDLKGNLDFQLASLQLILKTAKIDTNIEFIDLRFDKPVVKLAPKK